MTEAFVSAGSNIDPEINMLRAVRLLAYEVRVLALSTVYLTEPIGRTDQPFYYNCVLKIETRLQPRQLKSDVLRAIEHQLGRIRNSDKFAPRTIDLDLILYNAVTIVEDDLVLPDPDIPKRPFLTMGLYELAPHLILPGSMLSIADLAGQMQPSALRNLSAYTDRLRGELGHEQGKSAASRA